MAEQLGLTKGTKLAEYEVDSILGSGGFGITYKAFDHHLQRYVAIKEYFPSGIAERVDETTVRPLGEAQTETFNWGLQRFEDEARTLARFRHASILRVAQVMRANDTAYMVLDHLEGQTLRQRMDELGRPLTQEELDDLIRPLLDALETVHGGAVLHRDIAPKNIFLRSDGGPVLIDFGSARQSVTARTQAMTAVLTPGYAPFEQYMSGGETQGPWTDIYAMGATLYEAVTGELPPESPGRTVDDHYVLSSQSANAEQYRPSFLQAIDWALGVRPADRPQTVAEWREPLLAGATFARRAAAPPAQDATRIATPEPEATKVMAQGQGAEAYAAVGQASAGRVETPKARERSGAGQTFRPGGSNLYLIVSALAVLLGAGGFLILLLFGQTLFAISSLLAGVAAVLASLGLAIHKTTP